MTDTNPCDHADATVAYVNRGGQIDIIIIDCPACGESNPAPEGSKLFRMHRGRIEPVNEVITNP